MFTQIQGSDFKVGVDNFQDLQIRPSGNDDHFHYFYHTGRHELVKTFVLRVGKNVTHFCQVSLIEKQGRFTPRLRTSIRDSDGVVASLSLDSETTSQSIKASVDLTECHENFWKLINFLQSLPVDVPREPFSLIFPEDAEIVSALRERGAASLRSIIMGLTLVQGVSLTEEELNVLLRRKERLAQFEKELEKGHKESWWQDFFETNKWIFGYGLNYQILREEQSQPVYGGPRLSGAGVQRGDSLHSTMGDLSFTVLVEIKKPSTNLLQGQAEIRSGTWSLSKDLTDALAQIQTNIHKWEHKGADEPENRDMLESKGIYTVKPKGIIVIGLLRSVAQQRSRHETFQRFRQSVHGVEILTFDEIYNRARFIVDQTDATSMGFSPPRSESAAG